MVANAAKWWYFLASTSHVVFTRFDTSQISRVTKKRCAILAHWLVATKASNLVTPNISQKKLWHSSKLKKNTYIITRWVYVHISYICRFNFTISTTTINTSNNACYLCMHNLFMCRMPFTSTARRPASWSVSRSWDPGSSKAKRSAAWRSCAQVLLEVDLGEVEGAKVEDLSCFNYEIF